MSGAVRSNVQIDVLGALAAARRDRPIVLGPAKQRAIVAILALRLGESVPMGEVCDAVWGQGAPANARSLVHTYIARLRQILEPERAPRQRVSVLASTVTGYLLRDDSVHTDLAGFRDDVRRAEERIGAGDRDEAFGLLDRALRRWRDPSLGELRALLPDSVEVEALRMSWVSAARTFVGLGLRLRRPASVLDTAAQLVRMEPLHEAVQADYLAVLGSAGRRAEALERYGEVSALLRDELGVEPGPHLRAVHRTLLHPAGRPPVPRPAPSGAGRWWPAGPPVAGHLHGRQDDIRVLVERVLRERAVTVTGAPGSGKSAMVQSVAARVAPSFTDGVVTVDTVDLNDRRQLERRIARMLGGNGSENLVGMLRRRRVLLVLDNAEHLVDACALVAGRLLASCPDVVVLAGSRQPLGLWFESVFRLGPLPLPESDRHGDFVHNPAFALLIERAALSAGFAPAGRDALTVELCRRLDGLPMALEIAAARLDIEDVEAVLQRLDQPLDQFRAPPGTSPARHGSLRAVLQRSIDRLDPGERWMFERIGLLPEVFDLEMAGTVWRPHRYGPTDVRVVLSSLVDKSLVEPVMAAPGRYRMLSLLRRLAFEAATVDGDLGVPAGPLDLPSMDVLAGLSEGRWV